LAKANYCSLIPRPEGRATGFLGVHFKSNWYKNSASHGSSFDCAQDEGSPRTRHLAFFSKLLGFLLEQLPDRKNVVLGGAMHRASTIFQIAIE